MAAEAERDMRRRLPGRRHQSGGKPEPAASEVTTLRITHSMQVSTGPGNELPSMKQWQLHSVWMELMQADWEGALFS